jgi:transcriptional regulator with XRE-family HTH domain
MAKNSTKAPGELSKAIALKIRAARREAGISQEELGTYLRVSFQQIPKYEKESTASRRIGCRALPRKLADKLAISSRRAQRRLLMRIPKQLAGLSAGWDRADPHDESWQRCPV